jgi:signal transduction histidine kinase
MSLWREVAAMSMPVLKARKDAFPVRRIASYPVRLLVSAQLWKSLAFLVLNLPLGLVYFTVLVTLLTVGVGTLPIGIGLIVLAFVPLLVLFGTQVERWRVQFLLDDTPLSPQDTPPPSLAMSLQGLREFGLQPFGFRSLGTLLQRSWARAHERATWRSLFYLLLLYPLGTLETWVWSQLVVFTIHLALAVFNWAVPGKHRTAESYQVLFGLHVDSVPTALLFTFVGILSLVAGIYLVVGLAHMHRALAGWLLWPSAAERQAQLEARIRALDESRTRAVDAALMERQRIERDLHDGAQQRLVALAMDLGMAREKLATQPEAAQELVAQAHEEAKRALAELRDLVRGIHPAVLSDRGLDPALSAVAARCPVPVTLSIDLPGRLPDAVESTAYFVVAEALTNIAKHSGASEARVEVRRAGNLLLLDVGDDGRGGADPARGTGLAGIADRVAALDGRLTVISPPGGPTHVRAELPLP